ncbi:MAG: hypothetical protein PHV75_02360 [Victivallaceae bacterium]|nr:hypothetical protein [Victivallaceae bacterium]
MKKLLMFVLLCGLYTCTFAAFQYEVIKSSTPGKWNDGGSNNGIYGYSFFVKVTEGSGSLYILDKINNLYSMSGNSDLLSIRADMTNYGYVDNITGNAFNGDGSTITNTSQFNQWNDVITQTGYKLGDFNEGDEIGVWLTTNGNKTGASIFDKSNPVNTNQINFRDAFVGTDALGNDLFQLDFKNQGSIFFGITGVANPSPSGQPLPGVLATLLLGGGAFGILNLKKKKSRKA